MYLLFLTLSVRVELSGDVQHKHISNQYHSNSATAVSKSNLVQPDIDLKQNWLHYTSYFCFHKLKTLVTIVLFKQSTLKAQTCYQNFDNYYSKTYCVCNPHSLTVYWLLPVTLRDWPVNNEVVVEIFQTSEQLEDDALNLEEDTRKKEIQLLILQRFHIFRVRDAFHPDGTFTRHQKIWLFRCI